MFEIANTATGYAATPLTLVTFTGTANGADPRSGLIADAAGDLFGATLSGGAHNDGTMFELVNTGAIFAPVIAGTASSQAITDQATIQPFAAVTIADGNSGQTGTVTVSLSSAANGTLSNLSGGSSNAGVYSDTGGAAQVSGALRGLIFTPIAGQVAAGQTVTTGFTIIDIDTATASATDSTTTVVTTDIGPKTGPAAPTITGTTANQAVTDQATVAPFSNVVIADANPAQTETVTVTLSATANGTLTNLGGGSYNGTTGIFEHDHAV